MIHNDEVRMLADLSQFVAKYGTDPITRLASLMRDPQTAADLADLLEAVANRPQGGGKKRGKPKKTDRVGMGVLNVLRGSDPEKHALLALLREHLLSQTTLRSMADIRHFANTYGLSIGRGSSRNAAIAPLLQSMADLSAEEIAKLVEVLMKPKANDRSLESWRNVIVKPGSSADADSPDRF